MPRIFLSDIRISDNIIVIEGEKAVYITAVMRCVAGDEVEVMDGSGKLYKARISGCSKKNVSAEIVGSASCDSESPLDIRLYQGLLKGDRMDLLIQKTVELGVKEIVPVITERSQVRETRKIPRWQKIAEEASRQSGRSMIPSVHEAVPLSGVFGQAGMTTKKGIVFWEMGGEGLKEVFGSFKGASEIDILTGPEGGLTAAEVNASAEAGFSLATLGRRILRAETAAIAAVALVQFGLGDLGSSDACSTRHYCV